MEQNALNHTARQYAKAGKRALAKDVPKDATRRLVYTMLSYNKTTTNIELRIASGLVISCADEFIADFMLV